jgi:hypothetical protein
MDVERVAQADIWSGRQFLVFPLAVKILVLWHWQAQSKQRTKSIERTPSLQDNTQRCSWWLRSSGIWCCVTSQKSGILKTNYFNAY